MLKLSIPAVAGAAALAVAVMSFADDASTTPAAGEKIVTPSGLTIIEMGFEDRAAAKGDSVTVHYTGKLENGTVFDSSIPRNEAFTFTLGAGQVIRGWDEGVAGMKVGQKRQLIIPANLGYGDAGAPPSIPGGATLIFDVQVLSIKPANP